MSYYQLLYHIVFATKYRRPTINPVHDIELYKYIWGVTKNLDSKLHRINGIEDHIHLLVSIHPTVPLSEYVKKVKVSSNLWMKASGLFPAFTSWQNEYGAFTLSQSGKKRVSEYIKNQKAHHKKEKFYDELQRLLLANEISFDKKFL